MPIANATSFAHINAATKNEVYVPGDVTESMGLVEVTAQWRDAASLPTIGEVAGSRTDCYYHISGSSV